MDVINTLNSVSYNQSIAETIVVAGLFIVVLGVVLVMYWHTLIMGAVGVACLLVLMNHKDDGVSVSQSQSNGVIVSTEHDTYIRECMKATEYSKEQCEMAWKDRGVEKGSGV